MLSRGSDDTFTNAVDIRGRLSDGDTHQPRPDFWFGLGLYDEKQLSRLKGLEIKDKGIEYFTRENLEHMNTTRTEKLIYQPVESRKDAAFPWMVVESKHEDRNEKECIRQVANASHTSLMLCERLAARANMDALPIVAFTSVGPKAKIFIAYKAKTDADDKLYVRLTLISRECCPQFLIYPTKRLLFSVSPVSGEAILSTFCMLCNFDVLWIS